MSPDPRARGEFQSQQVAVPGEGLLHESPGAQPGLLGPGLSCSEGLLLPQVDAEQYYSELEEQLTDEFNAELTRVPLKRLDLIFVTFQDARTVKRWVLDDQSSNWECRSA